MSLVAKVLKGLLVAYLVSSYKSVPLAYYVRFYYVIMKTLVLPAYFPTKKKYDELAVFKPTVVKTYNSPFECDFYLHKSNSSYFTELDIARAEYLGVTFEKLFLEYKKAGKSWPFVPVGLIQANFKKEIKPFQRYNIVTRALTWDRKWLFLVSKFITFDPKTNSEVECCTAITKYVLKEGRKTIPPQEGMKVAGLYNEEVEKIRLENIKLVESFIDPNDLDGVKMYLKPEHR